MKAALLLIALLAGGAAPAPARHEMTAREAFRAADVLVRRVLPRLDRRGLTIRTSEVEGRWVVVYETPDYQSSGGPVIVQVDKRTRRAAITQMPN